jgi:hypothetical protein
MELPLTAAAGIEARLTRLENQNAILSRLYAYGHSIDYGDESAWVDCFTADGVWDVRHRRRADGGVVCRGRAELAAYIATHTRAPYRWHKHLLAEPVITVTGDTAVCDSYFVRLDTDDEGNHIVTGQGRYRDRLVREAGGVWRFAERIAEVEDQ